MSVATTRRDTDVADGPFDWHSINKAIFERLQRTNPYRFTAVAPSQQVRAPEADTFGPNRSFVWRPGIRTFYFETKSARDAFVRFFKARAPKWVSVGEDEPERGT